MLRGHRKDVVEALERRLLLSAAELAFVQQPTTALKGTVIAPAVTVAVENSSGQTVTTDSSIVTLTLSSATFATSGTNVIAVQAGSGVASFSSLSINTPGTYALTATDGALASAVSASFTITSFGPAAKLVFLQQPTALYPGLAISPAVTVAVEDAQGNIVTTDTSTVTLTPSGGLLTGNTAAAVNGVATFPGLILTLSPSSTDLIAKDGSLVTATSTSFGMVNSNGVTVSFNTATDISNNFIIDQNTIPVTSGTSPTGDNYALGSFGSGISTDDGLITNNNVANLNYVFDRQNLAGGSFASVLFRSASVAAGPVLQLGYINQANSSFDANASPDVAFITVVANGNGVLQLQYESSSSTTVTTQVLATGAALKNNEWYEISLKLTETAAGTGQFNYVAQLVDEGTNGASPVAAVDVAYNSVPITVPGFDAVNGVGADIGVAGISQIGSSPDIDRFSTNAEGEFFNAAQVTPNPNVGPTTGGNTVTLTGSNLAGTTAVTFGSQLASSFSVVSPSEVLAVAPAEPAGAIYLNVATKYGLASNVVALNPQGNYIFSGASTLRFTQLPTSYTAGAPLNPIDVGAETSSGYVVATDSSTVTLTLSGGAFAGGTAIMIAVETGGIATFSGLRIDATGTYTLGAYSSSGLTATSTSITITPAAPAALAFTRQPVDTAAGIGVEPPTTITIEDAFGNTETGNSSSVTLTLSGGTFASGTNTMIAPASGGVAPFPNLVIDVPGSYTLTAGDGALPSVVSSAFSVGSGFGTLYDNFNANAATFTSKFAVVNQPASTGSLTWSSGRGIWDTNGDPGGAVVSSSSNIDATAVYTPSTVNLSDGESQTLSEYVRWNSSLTAGDTPLQLGFLGAGSNAFNAGNSFISARILGSGQAEIQFDNGSSIPVSADTTAFTSSPVTMDFLQLVLTIQETGSGSLTGTFSVLDYRYFASVGDTNQPIILVAPVLWSVSGLTNLDAGTNLSVGFRTATAASPLAFDNFSFDRFVTTVDDRATGTGDGQIDYYSPFGDWYQSTLPSAYDGTVTIDMGGDGAIDFDSATVTFTGDQIDYYAAVGPAYGYASVSIDDNAITGTADLYSPTTQGDVLVYQSPLLVPGTHTLEIGLTSSNPGGGNAISIDRLDFFKATPQLAWATPPAITYGMPLGAAQLDATADVPGTFLYSQPAGTILPAGQNSVIATFVPTDTADYSTATITTAVNVPYGVPAVSAVNPSSGTFVGGSTVTIAGSNFDGATGVAFGVAPAQNYTVTSDTTMTAIVPAGTPGTTVDVIVTTPGGSSSTFPSDRFTYPGASKLGFTQPPTPADAGVPIAPPVLVAVEDPAGNTIPSDSSTVTVTLSTGTFASGGKTASTAAINGVATFANLAINSSGSYTVTATDGTLTAATSGAFAIVQHPSWLSPLSAATWNAGTSTLTVTGPALLTSDPGSAEPNIVASGTVAQLTIAPTTSDQDIHIGSILLSGGAGITVQSVGATRSHSNHNVLVVGTLGAPSDPTFSIDSSSRLDLQDNDLIIHTGSNDTAGQTELANVQALATMGRAIPPGGNLFSSRTDAWSGNGLASSTAAAADALTGPNGGYELNVLGVVDNSDLTLGSYRKWIVGSAVETLGKNDILVKYTYNGDFTLEGEVGTDAATIFSGAYAPGIPQNDFAFGDTNGDGYVDGVDATAFSGLLYGLGTAYAQAGEPTTQL